MTNPYPRTQRSDPGVDIASDSTHAPGPFICNMPNTQFVVDDYGEAVKPRESHNVVDDFGWVF